MVCANFGFAALAYCWSMIFFRKPVPTFRDHALGIGRAACYRPAPTPNGPLRRVRDRCFAAEGGLSPFATEPRPTGRAGQQELAMESKSDVGLSEALTFDDVLLKPGLSELLPADADIGTRITREIALNIPIAASAMDTVTEAKMAIAMAQAGGIGVLHRNLEPEEQAAQVRQVKKFESGMVVNPLTIAPQARLVEALNLMKANGISGIPVVEGGPNGRAGKLVGILTNRDVRFATDPEQPVSELMTKDRLITVRDGV